MPPPLLPARAAPHPARRTARAVRVHAAPDDYRIVRGRRTPSPSPRPTQLQPYAPPEMRPVTSGRPAAPLQTISPLPWNPFAAPQQPTLAVTRVEGGFKASGKTAVITGGSQGVGRATALLFARKGCAGWLAPAAPACAACPASWCALPSKPLYEPIRAP